MANHTTGAQRHNKRQAKIWERISKDIPDKKKEMAGKMMDMPYAKSENTRTAKVYKTKQEAERKAK